MEHCSVLAKKRKDRMTGLSFVVCFDALLMPRSRSCIHLRRCARDRTNRTQSVLLALQMAPRHLTDRCALCAQCTGMNMLNMMFP